MSVFGVNGPSNSQEPIYKDLIVPTIHAEADAKLRWIKETRDAGMRYLQSQRAYGDIALGRDKINGPLTSPVPGTLSKVNVNRSKRQIREIVESIASLKQVLAFSCDNKDFYRNNQILDKMASVWWQNVFADLALKEAYQYAAVEGLGYLLMDWDPDFWTVDRGDIAIYSCGAESVIPVEIGPDHNLQEAYAVHILRPMPLSLARSAYPDFADQIKPDEQAEALTNQGRGFVQKFFSPVLQRFGKGSTALDKTGAWPMTTCIYTYILDPKINDSGKPVKMGEPGTNWEYEVPYKGQENAVLYGYDKEGKPQYRTATATDARLYPFRRRIISFPNVVVKDGSSPFWHGMVPVAPVMFDKWPWDYLPYSLLREVTSIDEDNNQLLRVINDSARSRLRPPLAYDDKTLPESVIRRFDTRQEGQRIGFDFTMGDAIKPVLDPKFYDVPLWITEHIKTQEQRADYLMGTLDFSALSKLGQMPSGETIEDLMKAIGPLVNGMIRSGERTLKTVGDLWKGLALQFYTKARRVQILSVDHDRRLLDDQEEAAKDSRTVFHYDPIHLIPSHMPFEHINDPKTNEPKESEFSLADRARAHINTFFFYVKPGVRHQLQQMSMKLLYQTLWRAGFPLDPWTMADVFGFGEEFGPPPAGTTTIMERWQAFQRINQENAMEMAQRQQVFDTKLAMAAGAAAAPAAGPGGPAGPPGPGGESGAPAGNGSGNPGQAGAGRPPSGQEAPKMEQKGDGRSVVSESG